MKRSFEKRKKSWFRLYLKYPILWNWRRYIIPKIDPAENSWVLCNPFEFQKYFYTNNAIYTNIYRLFSRLHSVIKFKIDILNIYAIISNSLMVIVHYNIFIYQPTAFWYKKAFTLSNEMAWKSYYSPYLKQ